MAFTPRVWSWHASGDSRIVKPNIRNVGSSSADPTGAADTDSGFLDAHPVGQRSVILTGVTNLGASDTFDWPGWIGDKWRTDGPYLSTGITWFNTYWARVASNGSTVDHIIVDDEKELDTTGFRSGFGSTDDTHTITAASWSGGTATVTCGASHGISASEDIVIDGVTPTGYNGIHDLSAVDDGGGTISFPLASDPGSYSSGGTVYQGDANCMERMYQMVEDRETANPSDLKVPDTRIISALTPANFRSNAVAGTAASTWNPWVRMCHRVQLRKMILDTAESQLGYRPACSNYQDAWPSYDQALLGRQGEPLSPYGMTGISAPDFYLNESSGTLLTGSNVRRRKFQYGLLAINNAIKLSRNGLRTIPWISFSETNYRTMDAIAEIYKAIAIVLAPNGYYLFNSSATDEQNEFAARFLFETVPTLRRDRPVTDLIDLESEEVDIGGFQLSYRQLEGLI